MWGIPWWQIAAGAVLLTALTGSHWKAYVSGENHVQKAWNAQKDEDAAKQATADEAARLKARAAALTYEQDRQSRAARTATTNRGIDHALEANRDWAAVPLPADARSVLDALATAAPAIAGQPDRAVPITRWTSADEWGASEGLRLDAGRARGVFGAAQSPR